MLELRENLEEDLISNNFMGYQEYAEIRLLETEEDRSYCFRCNEEKKPLTYLDKGFYFLPCWKCSGKRKSEKLEIIGNIVNSIKDFYSKILGDRYFQLFIVDDIYFKNTIPHDYEVFKKIVNSIDPPSRNDIWFLDWLPGFPKIISQENKGGIKIVNLSYLYKDISFSKDEIKIGEYSILPPEIVPHDSRHYSRYNILNKSGDRKTKRIKVGDVCYRLYNSQNDSIKSIFRLLKDGEEIVLGSLSYQDYVIIKLAIMRNKSFLRILFDILGEVIKSCGVYRDSVFLKNTVQVNPDKDIKFNLSWNSISKNIDKDFINVSII